jgi:Mn-containing catalase
MPEKESALKNLLVERLEDLLSAEKQLVAALPKMVEAASEPKLRESFEKHLQQTKGHVERLRTVFQLLGTAPEAGPARL